MWPDPNHTVRGARRFVITLVIVVGALLSAPPAQAEKRALLIACTRYDDSDIADLQGPANDVVLMRDLLVTRFKFDPEHVRTLQAGDDPMLVPTYSNIVNALESLEAQTAAGDQVVLFFAGHGSQQPDDPMDPDEGVDGLDEILLPIDVKQEWVAETCTVRNAIRDDDVRRWLTSMLARDAEVLVIFDACHSGSGVRGDTVVRKVLPEELGIPGQLLTQARERGSTNPDEPDDAAQPPLDDVPLERGRWAAIYAAQPDELEPEARLPRDAPDAERKPYGLLTYTLTQLLQQGDALSYRELVQRIRGKYYADGRFQPAPSVEGSMIHQVVLGADLKRPAYALRRSSSRGLRIDAGQVHGLLPGTILAAFAADDLRFEKPLGHVCITEAGLAESYVEPCEAAGVPRNDRLPQGALCVSVSSSCGNLKLAVTVDDSAARSDAGALREELKRIEALEHAPLRMVEHRDDAQWVFMNVDDQWVMTSLDEAQRDVAGDSAAGAGGAPTSRPLVSVSLSDPNQFEQQLRQVQRVQSLLSVAAAANGRAGADQLPVDLDLTLQRADAESPESVAADAIPQLRAGDRVQWEVTNRSQDAVDVTLLFIDSQCGIEAIYPRQAFADNRLSPGQTVATVPFTVNAETVGREHMVLLAVRSAREPVNFSFLAQPTLDTATREFQQRGAAGPMQTPLGELLTEAFYQPGGAIRALRTSLAGEQRIILQTWTTLPPGQ
jgi:hypothetical protein